MESSKPEGKPFRIPKELVWEAYQKVKVNKGAPGMDKQPVADFEKDLKNNLYRIWNRMSSGSYFPSFPVRSEGGGNTATAWWGARSGGVRRGEIPPATDQVLTIAPALCCDNVNNVYVLAGAIC